MAEIKLKFKVSASGEILFCERFYQIKKGISLNINQSIWTTLPSINT